MPITFSGILATQTVPFRGTSTVFVHTSVPEMSNFRALRSAVYTCTVAGGVSGSFGVVVLGMVGGMTVHIAGNTTFLFDTVGQVACVLYPASYGSDGKLNALETATAAATQQIMSVPPYAVVFQSAIATAGISANLTVGAVLLGG